MQSPEYPDLLWVPCRWKANGRATGQPTKIVIHKTDNTAPAAAEAHFATFRPDQVSAHYFVDAVQVIQGVHTLNTAFAALEHGNREGIQYELCGISGQPTPRATLINAARQIARDMHEYGIPLVHLVGSAVRNTEAKGVTGHIDWTVGRPEDIPPGRTGHTDPGASFEWNTLFILIRVFLEGDTTMVDETDATEGRIWTLLDSGQRGNNETAPFPKPGGGTWSRPINWLVRRMLELEEAITALRTEEVPVTLTPGQLDELADKVVERLGSLHFEPRP